MVRELRFGEYGDVYSAELEWYQEMGLDTCDRIGWKFLALIALKKCWIDLGCFGVICGGIRYLE